MYVNKKNYVIDTLKRFIKYIYFTALYILYDACNTFNIKEMWFLKNTLHFLIHWMSRHLQDNIIHNTMCNITGHVGKERKWE